MYAVCTNVAIVCALASGYYWGVAGLRKSMQMLVNSIQVLDWGEYIVVAADVQQWKRYTLQSLYYGRVQE